MLKTKQVSAIQNVKKILGAYSAPKPPAVFYCLHFVFVLWETQSSTQKNG